MAVAGFGPVVPFGDVWTSGEAQWQWLKLGFGQTILAKRRLKLRGTPSNNMPIRSVERPDLRREGSTKSRERETMQRDLPLPGVLKEQEDNRGQTSTAESEAFRPNAEAADLDALTDWVIRSDFDPHVLGRAMLNCINSGNELQVERAVAFAAILAKAVLARRRRQRSR
jgi:hypothetical protein